MAAVSPTIIPFGPISDEVLAIREFFEWVASEIAECGLTPEETWVGLDLIAYRRGVDPEALIARLEDAGRKIAAEDLYFALKREQEAT